ncbi:GntR family transcriptional regulator [Rhizobium sp. CC-YZS058]|uniref:GntR family transcriptional regulator n=1 Tax=Rhizobium sp. CC-YZS058 TaxID=3042153 RepID=UPI002B053BC5|nr:GntR family transcriptional regulator [Rhizobium sp. CC-YZS058]MEA3533994.1 GntR family transcriptional regulator [Rhizobium sp. CC-YZS058]
MKETLKHRTLSGALLEDLRQAILSGVYRPGTQLRQDMLAATYNVSRIPIREVLFQLEAEGLVRIVPQKGAVVAPLSLSEIDDVFDLRALLEPRLLAASAPQLQEADFAALDALQARFVAATGAGDTSQYGTLNAALHQALYVHAAMPRTAQIVAALLQTSDRYTRLQLSTPEAMARAVREHAELIALCRQGQVEAAVSALKRHVDQVREDLLAVLELG